MLLTNNCVADCFSHHVLRCKFKLNIPLTRVDIFPSYISSNYWDVVVTDHKFILCHITIYRINHSPKINFFIFITHNEYWTVQGNYLKYWLKRNIRRQICTVSRLTTKMLLQFQSNIHTFKYKFIFCEPLCILNLAVYNTIIKRFPYIAINF